ncbi:PIN domain nuclease [Lactobacillus sp. CBA3605]|uniref:PIN/TRAM domain-containing protein n=1 Tax=Lactobacillus sp. CBA3605 TaxID=2099788 RepID=UPI000CFB4FD2|nr:PIN/TRAM domain-containing protein [Lactobacillus sp. CBA3605]AVK61892.1 PIN domain nuclease [Lactobacillus sp. CBA3605]
MKKLTVRLVFVIVGGTLGLTYLPFLWATIWSQPNPLLNNLFTDFLLGALILWVLSLFLANAAVKLVDRVEKNLSKQNPMTLLFGSVGFIIGLLIAVLISQLFNRSPLFLLNTVVPIILMLFFGYIGARVGTTRIDEWRKVFNFKRREKETSPEITDAQPDQNYHHYKILDTNILIDGRIYDLVKTGFLEGTLLVPNFVLYELQYIADSADSIKRVRGRRGLDILNKLQSDHIIPVEMYKGDFEDIPEVDTKLIQLAKKVNGVIVTNDYNLNKVIEFQNVQVLNINQLAKSLKPRVIPGEEMTVMVVKNGSERQQGVGYLDDGTMIVVEDGKFYINEKVDVVVTSALQTDAGRMIFARLAHANRGISAKSDSDNGHNKSRERTTTNQRHKSTKS